MKFIISCEDAGLHNGLCTPLWGPHRFGGIALATTEKKNACDPNLDLITAYSNHFYIAFQRLHAKRCANDDTVPNIHLSDRETEVLTLAAEGKTDLEIAAILKLTAAGVQYHLNKVYLKMHTNSRTYAASKAIYLGLIHPLLNPYVRP